jgi:hypothetical protein
MTPLVERLRILAFNAAGERFLSEPRMSAANPEMWGLRSKQSARYNMHEKDVEKRRKILT